MQLIDPVEQLKLERELILDYSNERALETKETASGLHYIIEEIGEGKDHPTKDSKISVYYKGSFIDDMEFDAWLRPNTPVDLDLDQLISAWQEGIPLMKKGGKIKLLVPSALAYGTTGKSGIPPNTILVFDIELLDFE